MEASRLIHNQYIKKESVAFPSPKKTVLNLEDIQEKSKPIVPPLTHLESRKEQILNEITEIDKQIKDLDEELKHKRGSPKKTTTRESGRRTLSPDFYNFSERNSHWLKEK